MTTVVKAGWARVDVRHGVSVGLAIAAAALLVLPLIAPSRLLGTLLQMQVAALFALAFNMLWQQTRLLSFGHAAYFGIGMFATVHAMRAVASSNLSIPLPLMPLTGAVAGLLLGIVTGFFANARTGTYFAMITLAFAELLHQIAPQWAGVFGGEAGLSTIRTGWGGFSFSSLIEVHYLVSAWFALAVAAIYFFVKTPLGRLGFALGDNEVRVRFIGYNARLAKTLIFGISAMFSGLAGALLAITNENADYTVFQGAVSGAVVLHTFIGGASVFFGPAVGAAALTLFGSVLSDVTRLWLLYQGALFVLVVLYLPQGVVGALVQFWNTPREAHRIRLVPALLAIAGVLAIAVGSVFLAEFISVIVNNRFALQTRGNVSSAVLWGVTWRTDAITTWATPATAIGIGLLLLRLRRRILKIEITRKEGRRYER